MNLALIGAGSVGSALGENWARSGHRIHFGLRDPSDPKHATIAARSSATLLRPAEAVAAAEVVILATPWPATQQILADLGDLGGRVLIDCTNPLGMTENGLALTTGFTTSGGEMVAQWARNARVVKALNQTGAEVMRDPSGFAHPPAMFLAGDDAAARATAATLIADLGFEPLDAGPLRQARLLEPLAMVWINQALFQGKGRAWAFGALPRQS